MKSNFNSILMGSKWKFILMCTMESIVVILQTVSALIYGELVNQVSRNVEIKALLTSIIFTLAYAIMVSLFQWFCNHQESMYFNKIIYRMRNDYFNKVVNAKYDYIASNDSSQYISNIQNDIPHVVYGFLGNILWCISGVIIVASSFIASLALNWQITLTMLSFTVVMALLPLFIKKKLDLSSTRLSKRNISYMGVIKEYFLGVSIIKGFSAEKVAAKKIDENYQEYFKEERKNTFINGCAGGLGNLVREISVVALIGLTCYFVYLKKVEVGAVLSIFSIGSRFYGGILMVSARVTYLAGIKGVKKTIESVFEVENSPAPTKALTFKDSIILEGVGFKYKDSEREILKNVTVKFEKNKKYLVLGKSGSGKSTLLKLISKYYDNYSGSIMLDGKDYHNISEKEATTMIAISQQNCYLFNCSFKNNIDFLNQNDENKLTWVIEQTALQDFVGTLANGYETVINEEVNQVSGGEKLRINLARALYRDSEALLLDEVTSSLDKKTAEIVEKNLLNIVDKTIINVCHKFNDNTLSIYDGIIIIENGQVVRNGSYKELIDDEILRTYRNVGL